MKIEGVDFVPIRDWSADAHALASLEMSQAIDFIAVLEKRGTNLHLVAPINSLLFFLIAVIESTQFFP